MHMTITAPSAAAPLAAATDDVEETILALWPTAYRIAKLVLRDHMAAEDVAQESCVRALAKRKQLRDPIALESWFRALVTHRALSARRRIERQLLRETSGVERSEHSPQSDGAAAVDLAVAIENLDDDLRLAVILVYYGGYTSVQAASRLGIAASTVRYRLAEARKALRPLLESPDE
jgi:RNA polymerase sigma-70 factor (ECF subfamily)